MVLYRRRANLDPHSTFRRDTHASEPTHLLLSLPQRSLAPAGVLIANS